MIPQNQGQFIFGTKPSPMGSIGALLIFIALMVGVFYLIKGAYWLLGLLAPVLLIATLIMDYTVVTGYLQTLWKMLKQNPLMGLVAILLTVLGAPFVAGFLFAKAWIKRTIKKATVNHEKEKYTTYEEVKAEDDDDFLNLPQIEKPKEVKNKNDYEDLFN